MTVTKRDSCNNAGGCGVWGARSILHKAQCKVLEIGYVQSESKMLGGVGAERPPQAQGKVGGDKHKTVCSPSV